MERKFGKLNNKVVAEDNAHDATADSGTDDDGEEVNGNNVSKKTDNHDNIDKITNNEHVLQVEADSGDEEGDTLELQQLGGEVDSHPQPGGDDGPPAANTRSKQSCSTCCCGPHHNFSLHATVLQPQTMPMAMQLSMHPMLVSYYEEFTVNWEQAKSMAGHSVENMIMSVGVKLRL